METIINNRKNTIFFKGVYDCKGGVEELKVTKTIKFAPFGALDFEKTILFEGDMPNISESDNTQEIKDFLENKFKEDGFEIIFSIL